MATIPLYQKPTILAFGSALRHLEGNAGRIRLTWHSDEWSLMQ